LSNYQSVGEPGAGLTQLHIWTRIANTVGDERDVWRRQTGRGW
jgi:hypothetical protein